MATGNPIARLFVRLGMDKGEFDRGIRDVQKQTRGMTALTQQMMAGVESAMGQTPLILNFLATLEAGIKTNRARLIENGKVLWDTVNEGIWQAMHKSDYVIKMARLIAPEVAKILIRDERYTTP